jgi:hypothetical protein
MKLNIIMEVYHENKNKNIKLNLPFFSSNAGIMYSPLGSFFFGK